jgi:hypothetical protein
MVQEHRERLISVTRADIKEAAFKYLGAPLEKGFSSKVIFGTDCVKAKELKEAGWVVRPPIEIISREK